MSLRLVIAARGGPNAKSRLASRFTPRERAALVEAMLGDMLAAAAASPHVDRTYVVTPTPELARIAARFGAVVMLEREPGGLNAAFEAARLRLSRLDPVGLIALLPGDLPRLCAGDLSEAAAAGAQAVVIAPSQSDGGTGAIVQPAGLGLPLAFGPGSFCRHCGGAAGLGVAVTAARLAGFSLDVDRPTDVERLASSGATGRAASLARALAATQGAAA